MTSQTVSVVGLGLIGGSVAAALRNIDAQIFGYDTDLAARQSVLRAHLVDAVFDSLKPAVERADTVVLAVPPLATLDILPEVDRLSRKFALVLDTAGVKAPIVSAMQRQENAYRFVGGHPLAGSERSGSAAARPDLFHGRPFALVGTAHTTPDYMTAAANLVTSLGARPILVSAGEHDAIVARTSHVAQLVSSALAASIHGRDERLAGPGLSGMTRLAASSPDLWLEILELNRTEISRACREFASLFDHLRLAIESEDSPAVEKMLDEARHTATLVRNQSA